MRVALYAAFLLYLGMSAMECVICEISDCWIRGMEVLDCGLVSFHVVVEFETNL